MNRRNLLKGILAAGVAPYVCTTAGVLMPARNVIRNPFLDWTIANVGIFEAFGGPTYFTDVIHPNFANHHFAHVWDAALTNVEMGAVAKVLNSESYNSIAKMMSDRRIEVTRGDLCIKSRIILPQADPSNVIL